MIDVAKLIELIMMTIFFVVAIAAIIFWIISMIHSWHNDNKLVNHLIGKDRRTDRRHK